VTAPLNSSLEEAAQPDPLTVALSRTRPNLTPAEIEDARQEGWTGPMVDEVDTWVRWALDHRTGLAEAAEQTRGPGEDIVRAAQWLVRTLWRLAVLGTGTGGTEATGNLAPPLPAEVVRPWFEVLIAAPETQAYGQIGGLLTATNKRADFLPWLALGTYGPMAYAAGLTHQEAATHVEAGTGDLTAWRLLAALRGYLFP
jgi:hypothetical protein